MALASGCGGLPEEQSSGLYPITGPDAAFSCSPENQALCEWVSARVNAATGWNTTVQPGGIPVTFGVFETEENCGEARVRVEPDSGYVVNATSVRVTYPSPMGCGDYYRTLTHELFHVACGMDDCHVTSEPSLMSAVANPSVRISSGMLDVVCARWGCPSPHPERSLVYPYPPTPPVRDWGASAHP